MVVVNVLMEEEKFCPRKASSFDGSSTQARKKKFLCQNDLRQNDLISFMAVRFMAERLEEI